MKLLLRERERARARADEWRSGRDKRRGFFLFERASGRADKWSSRVWTGRATVAKNYRKENGINQCMVALCIPDAVIMCDKWKLQETFQAVQQKLYFLKKKIDLPIKNSFIDK